MTQEEQIEQAAREYCIEMNYILPDDTEYSLEAQTAIAAYKHALSHQWISVDEELPELDNHGYSKPVLVRDEYGVLLIATYSGQHKKWNSVGHLSYHRLIVTHWMNIPPLEGGEK